jgi:hypothetical protein
MLHYSFEVVLIITKLHYFQLFHKTINWSNINTQLLFNETFLVTHKEVQVIL